MFQQPVLYGCSVKLYATDKNLVYYALALSTRRRKSRLSLRARGDRLDVEVWKGLKSSYQSPSEKPHFTARCYLL
jgi:hypothetical protein